ncbi:MAG: hypothetical protein ACTS27_10780 [Phycisphaerales bacterium]
MNASIKGLPARLVACCTASSAFAVAIFTGMFSGNTVDNTVSRALAAMVICYVVGRMVGSALEMVLRERLRHEETPASSAPAEVLEVDEAPIPVSPVDAPPRARAA